MRRVIPANLDLALLILRVALGAVLITHGLTKLTGFGNTAGFFSSTGVPLPTLAAAYATIVEVGGGILILLGVLVDVVGVLFAIDILGAMIFVHFKNGYSGPNGWEYPSVLFAVALALALAGPGRYAPGRRT
jgi:putative oxidoreductase